MPRDFRTRIVVDNSKAKREVKEFIKITDRLTGKMSRLSTGMKKAGKSTQKVGKNMKKAGDNLNKVNAPAKSVGISIGSLVPIIAGATAALVVFKKGFDFLAGSAKLLRADNKEFAKLEAIIKATGGAAGMSATEMSNHANAIQDVTAVSNTLIMKAQGMLATFKEIGGETFPRATQALVDMSAVQGSMEGNVLALGKALNDPIKGVGALSRVGVKFTEEQKEQIKVLQKSGDMMGAQTIILEELEGQFKGAAAAAALNTEKMAASYDDFRKAIASNLEPVIQSVSGEINELLKEITVGIKLHTTEVYITSGAYKNLGKAAREELLTLRKSLIEQAILIEQQPGKLRILWRSFKIGVSQIVEFEDKWIGVSSAINYGAESAGMFLGYINSLVGLVSTGSVIDEEKIATLRAEYQLLNNELLQMYGRGSKLAGVWDIPSIADQMAEEDLGVDKGFEDYLAAQQKLIDNKKQESDWNQIIIKDYEDLAISMGLTKKEIEDVVITYEDWYATQVKLKEARDEKMESEKKNIEYMKKLIDLARGGNKAAKTLLISMNAENESVIKLTEGYVGLKDAAGEYIKLVDGKVFTVMMSAAEEAAAKQIELEKEWLKLYEANIAKELEMTQSGVDAKLAIAEKYREARVISDEEYKEYKGSLEEDLLEHQMAIWEEAHQFQIGILDSMFAGYDTFISNMLNSEMTKKEKLDAIWVSTRDSFVGLLGDMLKEYIKKTAIQAAISLTAQAEQVASAAVLGPSVAKFLYPAAAMASLLSFGANSVPAMAGMTATVSLAQLLAIPKAHHGADFTVPQGYPNDSYPIMVESGEHVKVTPSGQSNRTDELLVKLIEAINNKPVANTVVFDDIGMNRYVERGGLKRSTI